MGPDKHKEHLKATDQQRIDKDIEAMMDAAGFKVQPKQGSLFDAVRYPGKFKD